VSKEACQRIDNQLQAVRKELKEAEAKVKAQADEIDRHQREHQFTAEHAGGKEKQVDTPYTIPHTLRKQLKQLTQLMLLMLVVLLLYVCPHTRMKAGGQAGEAAHAADLGEASEGASVDGGAAFVAGRAAQAQDAF